MHAVSVVAALVVLAALVALVLRWRRELHLAAESNADQVLTAEDVLQQLQRDVLTMPEELVLEGLAEDGLEPEDTKLTAQLQEQLREHKRVSLRAVAENSAVARCSCSAP